MVAKLFKLEKYSPIDLCNLNLWSLNWKLSYHLLLPYCTVDLDCDRRTDGQTDHVTHSRPLGVFAATDVA